VGHVERTGEIRNAYKIFVGKPKENRPLRGHRCRLEYNIKMDLKEMECEGIEWIQLVPGRVQ
jgi:hypothetical protein